MKKIYNLLAFFIILFGCTNYEGSLDDIAIRGGYILFDGVPNTSLNLTKLDTEAFSAKLIDPNKNALNYSLTAYYKGNVFENVFSISTFPVEIKITVSDLETMLGEDRSNFSDDTVINFVATVVSSTGTYNGLTPLFINGNSENSGGDTVNRLKLPALNQAMVFDVSFFTPPPYAFRQTSFEEPEGAAPNAMYTKPSGSKVREFLTNNPGEPIVTYVSQGTGRDNELGFTAEFVPVAGTGDSASGFEMLPIGVTTDASEVVNFPDGNQGYKIQDIDGRYIMTFDTVEIPAEITESGVFIKVFFANATWRTYDTFTVYANIESRSGVKSKINVAAPIKGGLNNDDKGDFEGITGRWLTYKTAVQDIKSYEVVIDARTSTSAKKMYWDQLIIYVPEP